MTFKACCGVAPTVSIHVTGHAVLRYRDRCRRGTWKQVRARITRDIRCGRYVVTRRHQKKWRKRLGLTFLYRGPSEVFIESADCRRLYIAAFTTGRLFIKTVFCISVEGTPRQ